MLYPHKYICIFANNAVRFNVMASNAYQHFGITLLDFHKKLSAISDYSKNRKLSADPFTSDYSAPTNFNQQFSSIVFYCKVRPMMYHMIISR